jgi:hypothetical protein
MTNDSPFEPDPDTGAADKETPCPECQSTNTVPDYGHEFHVRKKPKTIPMCCLTCGHEWGGE